MAALNASIWTDDDVGFRLSYTGSPLGPVMGFAFETTEPTAEMLGALRQLRLIRASRAEGVACDEGYKSLEIIEFGGTTRSYSAMSPYCGDGLVLLTIWDLIETLPGCAETMNELANATEAELAPMLRANGCEIGFEVRDTIFFSVEVPELESRVVSFNYPGCQPLDVEAADSDGQIVVSRSTVESGCTDFVVAEFVLADSGVYLVSVASRDSSRWAYVSVERGTDPQ